MAVPHSLDVVLNGTSGVLSFFESPTGYAAWTIHFGHFSGLVLERLVFLAGPMVSGV